MANNQLLASDNFASGSLAAGWGTLIGFSKGQVVAGSPNVVEPNALNTEAGQIWTGITWPNDQTTEVTMQTLTSGDTTTYLILLLRMQGSSYSGYRAEIFNQEARLVRFDNSVGTQIVAPITGLTFATGDVWSLQAAGACITLYQNSNAIFFAHDATYASGTPGFSQYTNTNIAHTQVAAWRGYSAAQQDGIWQKQGVVIPAVASDLSSNGDGTQNPSIIYEGNAQILSGTVLKMWFVSGASGAFALSYAESVDGKTWTRYSSNPVIASVGETVTVLKVGSTYHAYSSNGTANVTLYTSSDGVSWASQGTVFTQASQSVYFFSPLAVTGGTWYATYINNATTFPQQTRLATSLDGVTWTDYSGNPVVSNFWGMIKAFNVGGIWYAWGETTNPNAQETVFPSADPGEGLRMQTTDFIHWTNPVHSLHHSQPYESLNSPNGGNFPVFPIDVNGKMYLYSTVTPNDLNTAPQKYQIGLAIAPAPIASIALQPEDAVQQVATDNFTSGAGNLDANWTTQAGGTTLKIVAGPYVEPTATNSICQAVYTGAPFNANQYSEITIQTISGGIYSSSVQPMVRCSVSARTDYEGYIAGPTAALDASVAIYKRMGNVATQLGPLVNATPTVGDVWRLSVVDGSDGFPVLSLFQNEYLILQVQDQSNTPITSGNPGMAANSSIATADAQISGWAAGNANVIPNYIIPSSLIVNANQIALSLVTIAGVDYLHLLNQQGNVIGYIDQNGYLGGTLGTMSILQPTPFAQLTIQGVYGNDYLQFKGPQGNVVTLIDDTGVFNIGATPTQKAQKIIVTNDITDFFLALATPFSTAAGGYPIIGWIDNQGNLGGTL